MKVLKRVLCRVCNGFHLDSGKDIFNSFNGLTNTNFAFSGLLGDHWVKKIVFLLCFWILAGRGGWSLYKWRVADTDKQDSRQWSSGDIISSGQVDVIVAGGGDQWSWLPSSHRLDTQWQQPPVTKYWVIQILSEYRRKGVVTTKHEWHTFQINISCKL